jgi:murein DD-endopeptidase MepM/ murein hydrolase activator NlpD
VVTAAADRPVVVDITVETTSLPIVPRPVAILADDVVHHLTEAAAPAPTPSPVAETSSNPAEAAVRRGRRASSAPADETTQPPRAPGAGPRRARRASGPASGDDAPATEATAVVGASTTAPAADENRSVIDADLDAVADAHPAADPIGHASPPRAAGTGRRAGSSFSDSIERPASGRRARVTVPTTVELPASEAKAGAGVEVDVETHEGGSGPETAVVPISAPVMKAVSRRTLRAATTGGPEAITGGAHGATRSTGSTGGSRRARTAERIPGDGTPSIRPPRETGSSPSGTAPTGTTLSGTTPSGTTPRGTAPTRRDQAGAVRRRNESGGPDRLPDQATVRPARGAHTAGTAADRDAAKNGEAEPDQRSAAGASADRRRRRRRGGGGSDIAKGTFSVIAMLFAAGIAVATTLPAEALHAASGGPAQQLYADVAPLTPELAAQQLTTSPDAAGVGVTRDGYGVRDVAALRAAGMRIADTFTNNPGRAVQWPFPVGVPISDGFGPRESPGGIGSTDHKGVDFTPGQGTSIQSVADGVVRTVVPSDGGGLGVYVVIDHVVDGQPVSSTYGHMLPGSTAVTEGQLVKVGQPVGRVGNTGTSTGAHLHLEIRLDGVTPVDPFAWLTLHNA